jgi:hypothetical protein
MTLAKPANRQFETVSVIQKTSSAATGLIVRCELATG